MLDSEQLLHWCRRLSFGDRAEAVIQQVRSSAPARRVQGGRGNVTGRYPSRKMGVTIQFESHKSELPHIRELEHDEGVLEYYDQPPAIKLDYRSASGRRLGVLHTPDFFVLRATGAGWEECKTEEELVRLAEKNPRRYQQGEQGRWRCPPGETYAAQFGFYYRICSSAEINWTWQRNIEFLDDYLRADTLQPDGAALTSVRSLLSAHPRMTLGELFRGTEAVVSRDELYQMIASGAVYVDLSAAPLTECDQVHVFADREAARAYGYVVQTTPPARVERPLVVSLVAGSRLEWDGQAWTVANVGAMMLGLVGDG